MNMVRMCLNWHVSELEGHSSPGRDRPWHLDPRTQRDPGGAAFPLLALCPLAMVVMMWGMRRGMQGSHSPGHPVQPAISPAPVLTPEVQLAELQAQQTTLSRKITELEERGLQATGPEEQLIVSTNEGDVKGGS